jgi:hypothetical protein
LKHFDRTETISSEAKPQTDERVRGSGFRVQDFETNLEPNVLNPEPLKT